MLRGDGRPEGASRRGRTPSPRALRLIAIAALVVVAAIAVGAASRPHSVELSSSAPRLDQLAVLGLLVLACALGLILGSNPTPFWVQRPDRGIGEQERKSRLPWAVRAVLTLLPLMALAYLIASARANSDGNLPLRDAPGVPPVVTANSTAVGGANLALACIVVVLTSSLVAAVLFHRGRPADILQGPSSSDEVTAMLDEGLGALLAERDPRRAVIAAYVAMERAMARRGWARRPHEAPTEYLARVLGVAPNRERDLDELVGLYQFARFSEHAVTPSMRAAAVDSVRRLRAELQEPA